LGFVEARSDTSLFIFLHGTYTIYLLLYVDDIVLTASSATLLQQTISTLKQEFTMKDLGPFHHFLGSPYNIMRMSSSSLSVSLLLMFLSELAWWTCKPFLTVVDTQAKVSAKSRPHVANPTHFRSFVGSLQYLTFIHPDIAYTIQ
jgi:hypothetical protein